jgi:hypothetical protein
VGLTRFGGGQRCAALSGLVVLVVRYPGRRFALPWAGLSQPFGLNRLPLGLDLQPEAESAVLKGLRLLRPAGSES